MKEEFLLKIYYDEQGEEIEKVISNLLLKKINKNNVSWVFEFVIKYYIILLQIQIIFIKHRKEEKCLKK